MSEMESNGTCQNLVYSIQSELSRLPQIFPRRCIYRVPELLRQVNAQAYTPIVVSIGPYHHHDTNLLALEDHKLMYLSSFLRESQGNGDLHSYLQLVKDSETEIRQCYANPTTELSSDAFIRMVLLDSIFIIELFRRNCNSSIEEDDHIFLGPYLFDQVVRDTRLAENQLPFFILKDLYWSAFKPHQNTSIPYFTDLACRFLNIDKLRIDVDANTQEAKCWHLLDLLRTHFLPSRPREADAKYNNTNVMCPNAASLKDAGLKFQVANSGSCRLLDIQFDKEKGILTIPQLVVGDGTEILFRNLIGFEQCHYRLDTYISDYHTFFDYLIDNSQDVELLVKAEIFENWLGSEQEVSDMLNTLGKHVYIASRRYYYADISEKLECYSNKRWNRHRATLKHTYFRHPWAVISVVYAAILLVLTIIQAMTGIISVACQSQLAK